MATIQFLTSPLVSYEESGLFQALITTKGPSDTVEAKTVGQIEEALDAFAARLTKEDRTKAWVITAHVKTGRKPSGFDASQHRLRRFVNTHLVAKKTAAAAYPDPGELAEDRWNETHH